MRSDNRKTHAKAEVEVAKVNAEKTEKAIQEARVSEEGSQQVTPDRAQVDNSDKSSSTNLFKNGLSPINGISP